MKKLVQFLRDGKIHCENEEESLKILKDLKNLFGFSETDLDCQKILPKSVNEGKKKPTKRQTKNPAAEKMDCGKPDAKVMRVNTEESTENSNMAANESADSTTLATNESAHTTTISSNVEEMDCSPIESGDVAEKVDATEEKVLKKTGSKNFFVPWKPPKTSSKLVLVEDKENQGNQKVLAEL